MKSKNNTIEEEAIRQVESNYNEIKENIVKDYFKEVDTSKSNLIMNQIISELGKKITNTLKLEGDNEKRFGQIVASYIQSKIVKIKNKKTTGNTV